MPKQRRFLAALALAVAMVAGCGTSETPSLVDGQRMRYQVQLAGESIVLEYAFAARAEGRFVVSTTAVKGATESAGSETRIDADGNTLEPQGKRKAGKPFAIFPAEVAFWISTGKRGHVVEWEGQEAAVRRENDWQVYYDLNTGFMVGATIAGGAWVIRAVPLD